MRLTFAALLAAAVAAGASPAAACGPVRCFDAAVGDDLYPPGEPLLPAHVRELVRARDGRGLSSSGFYNDPSLAFAHPAPPAYDYAPAPAYAPEPAYAPPPPEPGYAPAPIETGYEPRPHHGPHVILSPYGQHAERHRRDPDESGPHVY